MQWQAVEIEAESSSQIIHPTIHHHWQFEWYDRHLSDPEKSDAWDTEKSAGGTTVGHNGLGAQNRGVSMICFDQNLNGMDLIWIRGLYTF